MKKSAALSLKLISLGTVALTLTSSQSDESVQPGTGFNVLFIAIDDLNDWVGFLDGHPQALTPNMDRLAASGMIFERAYCPVSVSNASRASLLTGFSAASTGVYGNAEYMRDSPVLKDAVTLPGWFRDNGFMAVSRGKIFHTPDGRHSDPQSWSDIVKVTGNYGKPEPVTGVNSFNGIPNTGNFDWGPTDTPVKETPDYQNAMWTAGMLLKDHEKPFFIACGIFRPHLPWFAPKEFFDKFPIDEIILPEIDTNDLDDIEGESPSKDYLNSVKYNKQAEAVQAYLANIYYADYCVGVILDALDRSPYRDNTIVVLWGDHGWHLGEKLRYKKFTLWEEACRMPLIIRVPGMAENGERCKRPVNLLDLYPTLIDLSNLPTNSKNEGKSLRPLLENPKARWDYPSVTTMGYQNHSVRTEKWRFISRNNGSMELYNHQIDPLERNNLAGNRKYSRIVRKMQKHLPEYNHPKFAGSAEEFDREIPY
jgi:arylsulfatase A-like enzyme